MLCAPPDSSASLKFQLWTFNFSYERRTGNTRLRLVAAGHPGRYLRAGWDRGIFRHAWRFPRGHAHEPTPLAGYRLTTALPALAAGITSTSSVAAPSLSFRGHRFV